MSIDRDRGVAIVNGDLIKITAKELSALTDCGHGETGLSKSGAGSSNPGDSREAMTRELDTVFLLKGQPNEGLVKGGAWKRRCGRIFECWGMNCNS